MSPMRLRIRRTTIVTALTAAPVCGFATVSLWAQGPKKAPPGGMMMAAPVTKAIAVLHATSKGGEASGTVTFTQTTGGVRVEAEVRGLTPGLHGFHIHEFGDCSSPDAMSAGGHFNPTKME